MVRPLVSKLSVTTTGRSVVIAPGTAASTSSAEDMVSIHSTSAPPAARACACSAKAAAASSMVSGAERHDQLAGGADRARDHDRPAGRIGDTAGDLGGGQVELGDPVLGLVQLEPMPGAAEAVGEDDVGAGLDEAAMHVGDALGMQRRSRARGCRRSTRPRANRPVPMPPSASSTGLRCQQRSRKLVMIRQRSPWRAAAAGCPRRWSARPPGAARAAAAGSRAARACRHRASARFPAWSAGIPRTAAGSRSSRQTPMQGDGISGSGVHQVAAPSTDF